MAIPSWEDIVTGHTPEPCTSVAVLSPIIRTTILLLTWWGKSVSAKLEPPPNLPPHMSLLSLYRDLAWNAEKLYPWALWEVQPPGRKAKRALKPAALLCGRGGLPSLPRELFCDGFSSKVCFFQIHLSSSYSHAFIYFILKILQEFLSGEVNTFYFSQNILKELYIVLGANAKNLGKSSINDIHFTYFHSPDIMYLWHFSVHWFYYYCTYIYIHIY